MLSCSCPENLPRTMRHANFLISKQTDLKVYQPLPAQSTAFLRRLFTVKTEYKMKENKFKLSKYACFFWKVRNFLTSILQQDYSPASIQSSKVCFFKNVLEKIVWPKNSQKLPHWNQWIQRGSLWICEFCDFHKYTVRHSNWPVF